LFDYTILVRNVTYVSKRLVGVSDLHYYALADGITHLLNRCGGWCRERHGLRAAEMQPDLSLFLSG